MFLPAIGLESFQGEENTTDFFELSMENSFIRNGMIFFNVSAIVVAVPLLVNIIGYEGSGFSKQRIFVNKIGQ